MSFNMVFSRLKLVPRPVPLKRMQVMAPILAVLLTLLSGLMVFSALGQNPLHAYHAFFVEPLLTSNGWSELLLKASPLCLIALGLAIAYLSLIHI